MSENREPQTLEEWKDLAKKTIQEAIKKGGELHEAKSMLKRLVNNSDIYHATLVNDARKFLEAK